MQVAGVSEERSRQQCELLERTWDTLNEATADLTNRGVNLPQDVYTSLRSSKSLIGLCRTHPRLSDLSPRDIDAYLGFCVGCCGQDVVTRIKCELRNVEDRLIIQAMNDVGSECALKLQQKTVKAWEPLRERIIPGIENLAQAIKVEKDVVSAYQAVIEENISYWLGVEEDIVDSYMKLIERTDNREVKSTLTEIVKDTKNHIEALESIRESFKKILADDRHHTEMLQQLPAE